MIRALVLASIIACGTAFSAAPRTQRRALTAVRMSGTDRRQLLQQAGVLAGFAALGAPSSALASGGATAGKYTSIPVAKRRYYGRVKQAVYEWVLLGKALQAGDTSLPEYKEFFEDTIVLNKGKRKTNCLGDERQCTVDASYTSRWADMQLSMSLLGNAFRIDASKPPEKIPQVKLARKFFADMEAMRKSVKSKKVEAAQASYASAKGYLEEFLNLVDLPPTDNEMYAVPSNTAAETLCKGDYCI